MSDQFSEGLPKRSDAFSESVTNRGDQFSEGVPKRTEPLPSASSDAYDDDHREFRPLRPTTEERIMATFAHGAGVVSWTIAPLIFYLMQSNRKSLAGWHAREAFNFQLSTTIYYFLPLPLVGLVFIDFDLLPLAVMLPVGLMLVVAIFEIVIVIIASIAAYHGQFFRCPLNIPFIPRPQLPFDSDDHADVD